MNKPMKVGDQVEWNYQPKKNKNFFIRLIEEIIIHIQKNKT